MARNKHLYRRNKETSKAGCNLNSQKSCQPKHDTSLDIDVEKTIEKHSISILILKVSSIIFTIAIHFWLGWVIISSEILHPLVIKIIVLLFIEILALGLFFICYEFLYKMLIKWIVKSIDIIKCYNLSCRMPMILREFYYFNISVYSSKNQNITEFEIGDTSVTASQIRYYQSRSCYHRVELLFQADFFVVDKKNKLIPNGILLESETFGCIKHGIYQCRTSRYVIYSDTDEAFNNCDQLVLIDIANKIYNACNAIPFALYFANDVMYFVLKCLSEDFELHPLDFNIKKYLRRDLQTLQYRIYIAKILASL